MSKALEDETTNDEDNQQNDDKTTTQTNKQEEQQQQEMTKPASPSPQSSTNNNITTNQITNDESETDTEPENTNKNEKKINLKAKFHKKLINILTKYNLTFETANMWMLNQVIIPLGQNTKEIGNLKTRYSVPENDFIVYNNQNQSQLTDTPVKLDPNESIHNVSLDAALHEQLSGGGGKSSRKTSSTISKIHIHTCYAFNQHGQYSMPLIVYPKGELDNQPPIEQAPIRNTICLDESQNGDLNEEIFIKWLKSFLKQINQTESNVEKQQPLLLMCNSIIPISNDEIIRICVENCVYLLFYPLDDQCEIFNKSIYYKFKDAWRLVLTQYSIKDNPNTKLAFLYIYKQVLRKILNIESIKECFKDLLKIHRLPKHLHSDLVNYSDNEQQLQQQQQQQMTASNGNNQQQTQLNTVNNQNELVQSSSVSSFDPYRNDEDNDENDEPYGGYGASSVQQQTNNSNLIKFTDQEVSEYIEWINYMCSIGCLCIKYTFLRDLNHKYRFNSTKYSNREVLVSEKKWVDLIKKNKTKLKVDLITMEDDYFIKWFDMDTWRASYYQQIKSHSIHDPASIWTFDIISFPYVNTSSLLRAPERDVNRPRNIKSRISVIFAFNASGDYCQPYFVYPTNFISTENFQNNDLQTYGVCSNCDDLSSNECYSYNGFVNCRTFNVWLNQLFIPYIREQEKTVEEKTKKQYLLMYCGKLAVFDYANMKQCIDSRINLFSLTHDSVEPFQNLFQKNLRKRQTDLLLDSWRKITAKRCFNYQFKCKSKQIFTSLFMDAYQNCIEEIGDFKSRIVNTFEVCNLWPINDDEYKQFVANSLESQRKRHEKLNGVTSNSNLLLPPPPPPPASVQQTENVLQQQRSNVVLGKGASKKGKANKKEVETTEEEEEADTESGNNDGGGYWSEEDDDSFDDDGDQIDYGEDECDDEQMMEYSDDEEFIPNKRRRNNSMRNKKKRKSNSSRNKKKKNLKRKYQEIVENSYEDEEYDEEEAMTVNDVDDDGGGEYCGDDMPSSNGFHHSKVSLADICETNNHLKTNIKTLIEAELLNYFNEKCVLKKLNDNNNINKTLINDIINQIIQKSTNTNKQINGFNGSNENMIFELINNYLQKYTKLSTTQTTNETSNKYSINNLNIEQVLNDAIKNNSIEIDLNCERLYQLYVNNINNECEFLKQLCLACFPKHNNNNNNNKHKNCAGDDDINKKLNFIKTIMFKLYTNVCKSDINWSKCLTIIDENL